MEAFAVIYVFVIMFGLGLVIGQEASKRNPPNEPPPRHWQEQLHAEWIKGYKAGEKSTIRHIAEQAKKDRDYQEWRERTGL